MEIPSFLLQLAEEMNTPSGSCISNPLWQVKCRSYIVTAKGSNVHHTALCDNGGYIFYRSDKHKFREAAAYLWEHYSKWCAEYTNNWFDIPHPNKEDFISLYTEKDSSELPSAITYQYMQQIEEVISTHLTQQEAQWFIERKKPDYRELYVHATSLYWSPQLCQLQDWIKSLSKGVI